VEQTQKEMIVQAIASSMIEAIKNSSRFADKINEVATDALKDAIDDIKNSVDVSIDDDVLEAITKVVDSMTWSDKEDVNEALDGLVEAPAEPHPLALNKQYVRQIDAHVFYQAVPKTTEELVAYMRFACECEDVGFLEVAKRINHMQWILSIL
jgi:uncharacterized protein (DUF4415 family)